MMRRGELKLSFQSETRRFQNANDDCVIAVCRDEDGNAIDVKGSVDPGYEFEPGLTYRFFGKWKTYRDTQQWNFTTFTISTPLEKNAVIQYIAKLCQGIGKKTATAIWDKYGARSLSAIKSRDSGLVLMPRITQEIVDTAAKVLTEHERLEECTIELMTILEGEGFPKRTIQSCIDRWGVRAREFVERNPYLLMSFRGCGFRLCDKLYLKLGHKPGRLKRQALCCWYGSAKSTQATGNTWNYLGVVQEQLKSSISGADVQQAKAIELCSRSQILVRKFTNNQDEPDIFGDRLYLAESHSARQEFSLARRIVQAMHEPADWPEIPKDSGLYPHQAEELGKVMAGGCIGILGGGPGTGKSHSTGILMKELIRKFGGHNIVCGAPTGRAAVRLTEAMAECGVTLVARTWHSILGVKSVDPWEFEFHAGNRLPCKVMVIDEFSMTDLSMAAKIFAARPANCLVLIVGDVNQLPPVGSGAPLRDMLMAGVPQGELTEVHRNSGKIVEICHAIKDGQAWKVSEKVGADNVLIKNCQKDQLVDTTLDVASDCTLLEDFDLIWDCQVIVATNKVRKELNRALQKCLNKNPEIERTPFRLKDKVICMNNSWLRVHPTHIDQMIENNVQFNDRDEVFVANGEIGIITECEPNKMIIKLANPFRVVTCGRLPGQTDEDGNATTGCPFDLAYAITVHKGQGSSFPCAIVYLDPVGNCDRSWLYTAISRAKKYCILVGQKSVANKMCAVNRIHKRKTFLRETIIELKREFTNIEKTPSVVVSAVEEQKTESHKFGNLNAFEGI